MDRPPNGPQRSRELPRRGPVDELESRLQRGRLRVEGIRLGRGRARRRVELLHARHELLLARHLPPSPGLPVDQRVELGGEDLRRLRVLRADVPAVEAIVGREPVTGVRRGAASLSAYVSSARRGARASTTTTSGRKRPRSAPRRTSGSWPSTSTFRKWNPPGSSAGVPSISSRSGTISTSVTTTRLPSDRCRSAIAVSSVVRPVCAPSALTTTFSETRAWSVPAATSATRSRGRCLAQALGVVGVGLHVEARPSVVVGDLGHGVLGGIHRADVHVEPGFEPVQDPPEADILPMIGPGDGEVRREARHGARC